MEISELEEKVIEAISKRQEEMKNDICVVRKITKMKKEGKSDEEIKDWFFWAALSTLYGVN